MTHLEQNGATAADSIRRADDTIGSRVGDEMVLIQLGTDKIYELNLTGARLWELLGEVCDRSELQLRLAREFDVDAAELSGDVDRLLAALRSEGPN
jgi:hypothetical protein